VAAETRRRLLIAEKLRRHRGQPADGEDGRNAETHFRDAEGTIAKDDGNFDDPQIPAALDESFEGDLKTGGRWS
jgi:hypothetical protein